MVILILIVLGLCLGSFVNAFVWRFHKQQERQQLSGSPLTLRSAIPKLLLRLRKRDDTYSITTGRSMCVHCEHELAPKDLIPVVSYVWLRGKCRYCRKPIDDTPIPELVTPLLFVVSYIFWPVALSGVGLFVFVAWLVFLVGFVVLSLYDYKWYELPHRIVLPLIGLAALQAGVVATVYDGGLRSLGQAATGALIGGGVFYILYIISPKEKLTEGPDTGLEVSKWIGFGDITLGVLLGLLVGGPSNALLLIFVASLLGTLVALPLMAIGRATRTSHLPFGPFLMAAAVIVKLWGAALIAWYTGQFIV